MMKDFAKTILLLCVSILYIVSTMGIGVHRCTVDASASVKLLFAETPCDASHSCQMVHTHSFSCSGEDEHSSECCSTDVYVVTPDQTLTDDNNIVAPQISYDVAFINQVSEILAISALPYHKDSLGIIDDAFHKKPSQAVIGVFRV